ncbi:hypothetical protein J6X73_00005 [Candidatus Saccharibacteria bacterium]|nr:hypothetical protein [Candidatus Saccharibacteria bacterium]
MKKPIALVISIVLSVGQILNPATVLAMTADDVGGEYWYIPELIERDMEVEAEIKARNPCLKSPDYYSCLEFERARYIRTDGNRYKAVWQLRHSMILVTAINPYRNTIRVYYTGDDRLAGDEEETRIAELYVYWLDNEKIKTRSATEYIEQIKSGEVEDGVHVVYAETRHGDEPWIESREEIRLVLSTGSFTGNIGGKILYAAIDNAGRMVAGGDDYLGRCLSNEEFDVGQECRGSYYMLNNTYSYRLVSYDEIDEDKTLDISPLVVTSEPTDTPEENPDPEEELDDEMDFEEDLELEDEPEEISLEEDPELEDESDDMNPEDDSELEEESGEMELEYDLKPEEETILNLEGNLELEEAPEVVEIKEPEGLESESVDTEFESEVKTDAGAESKLEFEPYIIPKTPDTGEPPHDGDSGADWCLPMVISLGIVYIIWWIIPVGKKRRQ